MKGKCHEKLDNAPHQPGGDSLPVDRHRHEPPIGQEFLRLVGEDFDDSQEKRRVRMY
jgi:hypothetical protein